MSTPTAQQMAALAKKMLSQPSVKEPLCWFVTDAPFYHVVEVNWPVPATVAVTHLPAEVAMPCDRCQAEATNWELASGGSGMSGQLHRARYDCRNCKESSVTIYYSCQTKEGKTHFEKVGRVPKFQINPPKELGKALGQHRALYIQGKTLRHHNCGLGALVYFRRLVEETTDELLDLLKGTLEQLPGDHSEELKTIHEAKKAQPFQDKVKIAAKALPSHLRPGNQNPLGLLHDLLSYDIHQGTDEDAITVVDKMDKILEYLFTQLEAHTQKSKEFVKGLKGLTAEQESRRGKKKSS